MPDIRLKPVFDLSAVTMDWLLKDSGRLDESQELANAVKVALGTDALASADDILPDPDSTDRRGWWGDYQAQEVWDGWPIGTKNWLLSRSKITDVSNEEGSTLERARIYTANAIQPFIDRRVASRVDVDVVRTERGRIEVSVKIYRGPIEEIDLRYQLLWDEIKTPIEFAPLAVTRVLSIPSGDRLPDAAQLTIQRFIPTVGIVPWQVNRLPSSGNLVLSTTAPTRTQAPWSRLPARVDLFLSTTAPIVQIIQNTNKLPAGGNVILSTTVPIVQEYLLGSVDPYLPIPLTGGISSSYVYPIDSNNITVPADLVDGAMVILMEHGYYDNDVVVTWDYGEGRTNQVMTRIYNYLGYAGGRQTAYVLTNPTPGNWTIRFEGITASYMTAKWHFFHNVIQSKYAFVLAAGITHNDNYSTNPLSVDITTSERDYAFASYNGYPDGTGVFTHNATQLANYYYYSRHVFMIKDGADSSVNVTVTPNALALQYISGFSLRSTLYLDVTLLSPDQNETNVNVNSNFVLTFNRNIVAGSTASFRLYLYGTAQLIETLDETDFGGQLVISGNTLTIDWSNPLQDFSQYYILADYGSVKDANGEEWQGISDALSWFFTSSSVGGIELIPDRVDLNFSSTAPFVSISGASTLPHFPVIF